MIPKLTRIKLDDGNFVFIEVDTDVQLPPPHETEQAEEEALVARDGLVTATEKLKSIQETIRCYADYTLSAFSNLAAANVDKVTLEFGVKIGGEAGIPYITKGTAESNLKVTVECSFTEKTEESEGS